jgi:hypothetical protein
VQPHQTPGSPIFFVVFIALAAYAIAGSDKKWRTLGLVLLSTALGLGIGAAVGFALRSPAAAGDLAGGLLMIAGAATSIRQIIDNRRRHKKQ